MAARSLNENTAASERWAWASSVESDGPASDAVSGTVASTTLSLEYGQRTTAARAPSVADQSPQIASERQPSQAPLSASSEDHRAAQGKVVLDHQLHHVSRVHVDHRCQIGHPADQADQDLDVIAG